MYENNSYITVADAWHQNQALTQANMSTDGKNLYSYGHLIGYTTPTGEKVALECAASRTTSKHGGHARTLADRVEACPERKHWSQRVERLVRNERIVVSPVRSNVLAY